MPTAFSGPQKLKERIGTLDARAIAAMDPAELEAAFRETPAIHRFPGSMAQRVQELCAVVADEYGGDAERVWTEATDAADLRKRIGALPGFGKMKITGLGSVLALHFGVEAAQELVPEHPCLGQDRLARGARRVPGGEARPQERPSRARTKLRTVAPACSTPGAPIRARGPDEDEGRSCGPRRSNGSESLSASTTASSSASRPSELPVRPEEGQSPCR